MNEHLNRAWDRLNFKVIDALGANRRVKDVKGQHVVSGGYQREMQWLSIHQPMILKGVLDVG